MPSRQHPGPGCSGEERIQLGLQPRRVAGQACMPAQVGHRLFGLGTRRWGLDEPCLNLRRLAALELGHPCWRNTVIAPTC